MRRSATPDPFGTAALRSRVLAAWAASPARFREDANAEDELVHGAYRDRLVVELAQNAADAAARARVPGRLLLRLDGTTLTAANVGAPLDDAGVEGLSMLRASAKRDDDPVATVGRFGVGFAAVLAVTDAPAVLSRPGGVRWSRAEASAEAARLPGLADELGRRGGAVPVLRLPFPAGGAVPDGYDTVVSLLLRDAAATALVARLLAEVDDALLLALPALAEVAIDVDVEDDGARRTLTAAWSADDVVIADVGRRTRWRLARRTGQLDGGLLANRPVEERLRPYWAATVAVPVSDDGSPAAQPPSVSRVVHSPTPTDDRTALPALVIGSFPLDSARRRVAPGPLTEWLVGEVARAYASLAAGIGVPAVLDLVPGPLAAGELDAALHRAVVAELAATPLVPSADGASRLRPDEVVLVPELRSAANPAALAGVVGGLPAMSWWREEPLRRLGAREVPLAEVVDQLAGVARPPAGWLKLYAALDGADIDALAALPVPLSDGRVVRGARGVLLPTSGTDPGSLVPLGLRLAATEAVHPLLARLGAIEATPASVLRDPAVRAAVESAAEEDNEGRAGVVAALLDLVAAAGLGADEEPWLAATPLSDATGHAVAAGDLLLPDSPVLGLLDVDPAEHAVGADAVARWGPHLLRAVGVRDGFCVARDADVPLDGDCWHDLDAEDDWVNDVVADLPVQDLPPVLAELYAVRDLDLVRDDAWPDALALLAGDPTTRPALVEPAYAVLRDGSRRTVTPYTVWWLRTHARIGGRRLVQLCSADAEPLVRKLLAPLGLDLDAAVTRALLLPRTLADVDTGPLLDVLADSQVVLTAHDLGQVYAALESADPNSVTAPQRVRVPDGAGSRVVAAAEVVVADGPYWLQLGLPAVVPGGRGLADVLDVDLAADVVDGEPATFGTAVPVPRAVDLVLADPPDTYVEHDDLVVAGRSVDWWVDGSATVHASTPDGLARGLAWTARRWELRFLLAEALRDPSALPVLLAEQAYERPDPSR
ncbi:MAG: sacsin N-terminal ATP-binding-like domain-containing protein [Jiangellaceae bacterium]